MRTKHIIDFHVHCFPEHVAERAMAALAETYELELNSEGKLSSLLAQMSRVGIDRSVILPVAAKPSQVRSINDWVASLASERIIAFGAMHPGMENPLAELARMKQLGLKGIKLQPQWQGFRPDDPRLWPIFEAMAGEMIVSFHAGDEIKSVPEINSTPERLAAVHEAFPNLTMVAAHFGGFRMWDEVEKHLVGKQNVFFDTSYCRPEELPDARMLSLIRAHGASQILFASDSPFGDPETDLARLQRLGLAQEELEAICWQNAARLLGLTF